MPVSGGTGATGTPAAAPAETFLLHSDAILGRGDELVVERESDQVLQLTWKSYPNALSDPPPDPPPDPHRDTRYLDLKVDSVLLYYGIAEPTNLSRLWNVAVVYGRGVARKTIEYPFKTEADAFRFQQFVTGYLPYKRFRRVTCSSLEQHHPNPFKRATEIDLVGEVQLWRVPPKQPPGEPLSPWSTRSGSSPAGHPGSVLSATQTLRRATLQTNDVAVTNANTPPLLVCFARQGEEYQMMRVNLTDLTYERSPTSPNSLNLVSSSKRRRKFSVYTRTVQQVEAWNLCHLRPGVYSRHFQRHECSELTLDFDDANGVLPFQESLVRTQIRALGGGLPTPGVSRQSSTTFRPPQGPLAFPSLVVHPEVDDSNSTIAQTVPGEEPDPTPTVRTFRDDVSTQPSLPPQGPPGRPQVQVLQVIRETDPSVRSGRHRPTASRDGSLREKISRWARGSTNG